MLETLERAKRIIVQESGKPDGGDPSLVGRSCSEAASTTPAGYEPECGWYGIVGPDHPRRVSCSKAYRRFPDDPDGQFEALWDEAVAEALDALAGLPV